MAIDPADYDDADEVLAEVEARADDMDTRDVLTDAFMDEHTAFDSAEAMVEAGPFAADDRLPAVGSAEQDEFVAEHSEFRDLDHLTDVAVERWVDEELGL
jgi:hypothetical protein